MAKAGDEIGTVVEIWRYPVQSMRDEALEAADIVASGAKIAITENCERCVMTTLPQGDPTFDPAILHAATTHNSTRGGVYAAVVRPGAIKVGDPVRPLG